MSSYWIGAYYNIHIVVDHIAILKWIVMVVPSSEGSAQICLLWELVWIGLGEAQCYRVPNLEVDLKYVKLLDWGVL